MWTTWVVSFAKSELATLTPPCLTTHYPPSIMPCVSAAKSYSQVQRAWEKSAGMSQRDILMVARGAGKVDDPSQESERSRKRRAMAGCKDETFRKDAGYDSEASCNSRVLGGDPQFMLDVLNAQ